MVCVNVDEKLVLPEIIAELNNAGYDVQNANKVVKKGIDNIKTFGVLCQGNHVGPACPYPGHPGAGDGRGRGGIPSPRPPAIGLAEGLQHRRPGQAQRLAKEVRWGHGLYADPITGATQRNCGGGFKRSV